MSATRCSSTTTCGSSRSPDRPTSGARCPKSCAVVQEGSPRDGRQERHHGDGRCDLDLAVEGCLWGGFGTTGQRCTAASRVVVHEQVYRPFSIGSWRAHGRSASATASIPVFRWDRWSAPTAGDRHEYVEIGGKEGATLACGGHALTTGAYARASSTNRRFSRTCRRRCALPGRFRPGVSVMRCQSVEEAVTIANGCSTPVGVDLHAGYQPRLFGHARCLHRHLLRQRPNDRREDHLPFGGTKATGNGHREAGTAALEVFSEWKSVYVDFSGKLQRAQIARAEV